MQSMTVGELKTNFSEVLQQVQQGKEFQVLYGRAKKPVARLCPINEKPPQRKIGLLDGKASFTMGDDFKFKSEEEFLGVQ